MTKTIRANGDVYGAPTRGGQPVGPNAASEPAAPDMSVLGAFDVLLRNRRLLILLPTVLIAVTASMSLLARPTYTTTFSFMPQSAKTPSTLAGVAAQFGVLIPTDAAQSPAFYVDLLDSRAILAPVIQSS